MDNKDYNDIDKTIKESEEEFNKTKEIYDAEEVFDKLKNRINNNK